MKEGTRDTQDEIKDIRKTVAEITDEIKDMRKTVAEITGTVQQVTGMLQGKDVTAARDGLAELHQ